MSLQVQGNLKEKLAQISSDIKNRKPILQAMGAEFVSITIKAFRDASLRALPWQPKKDGTARTLIKSGALWHSLRVIETTNNSVTSGSDRPYAAIQQLGGKTPAHKIIAKYKAALAWPGAKHPVKSVNHPGSKIPPSPFFPVTPSGQLTPDAKEKIDAVAKLKIEQILNK